MSVYGTSLLVWVDLLQGAFSQTETHIHGEKARHKIVTKTKPAGKGGHCLLVHTALWRASHASGNGQYGMMSQLWERGCEEDSDYHQVVGDGASGQVLRYISSFLFFESNVFIEN